MSVSLVSVLVSHPVLVCVAFCGMWRVLGSILSGAGKLSLLCTGLPHFSMIIIYLFFIIILKLFSGFSGGP